jgi:hydrogenase nickel incorporation protein HypB
MAEIRLIDIREDILSDNQALAGQIRERLRKHRIFLMNLMASPGGGKTSLILQTLRRLKDQFRMAVIEGDIDSQVDSEKIIQEEIPAVQIRTGGFCHLDASMIGMALSELAMTALDVIIVENIGNLVCPAEFDIGATRNVMILSVPEGDDKPLKYPLMFSVCDALVVNKTDYLEGSDFDMATLKERVFRLNPKIRIFPLSCRTGRGIDAWTEWLAGEIATYRNVKR